MIDYLISDQERQIWINLELYFERYEFFNFYGFFIYLFEFNWIYFELNRIKKLY